MSELVLLLTIFMMLLSLFLVLLESKILAYSQSSMGPAMMGSNGIFQMILDLIKLLSKEIFLMPKPSSMIAPMFLSLLYSTQLVFLKIFMWSPYMYLFDSLDSTMMYNLVLMMLCNVFFVLVGFLSQSKYAMMGTISSLMHMMSLDIFMTMMYSILMMSSQSTNFNDFVFIQNNYWFFFMYTPMSFLFMMVLLLESKSAPFDHSETESEVVAGYSMEYSGPMVLIFYLSEYLHLMMASMNFMIFFMGGWFFFKFFFFMPTMFLIPNDIFILM